MTKSTPTPPKIIIPEFGKDDLIFAAKYLENFPACLLTLIIALAWRAIITSAVKGQMEITQIASLPSQKFIASGLFQRSIGINSIYAAVAIRRTANLEIQEYLGLSSDEEKEQFIRDRIKNLATSNGKAQILNPRQISSPDDIVQHRRGLMASFRGTHTTTCIYSPQNIFAKLSVPIQDLMFQDVVEMFYNILNLLDVKILDDLFVSEDKDLKDIYNEVDEETQPHKFFGLTLITINPAWKVLHFSDGVKIANSNYPDRNILAFEYPLVEVNNLTRGLPSKIGDISIPEAAQNDPFVQAAVTQIPSKSVKIKPSAKPSTPETEKPSSSESPEVADDKPKVIQRVRPTTGKIASKTSAKSTKTSSKK